MDSMMGEKVTIFSTQKRIDHMGRKFLGFYIIAAFFSKLSDLFSMTVKNFSGKYHGLWAKLSDGGKMLDNACGDAENPKVKAKKKEYADKTKGHDALDNESFRVVKIDHGNIIAEWRG